MSTDPETPRRPANFIRDIVAQDVAAGLHGGNVVTRFPPEPNGYLHVGHAYAIGISHGIAREFGGRFHLRYDDTNPTKEELEYVESQARDIEWLGVRWDGKYFASDYFGQMADLAVNLIEQGKAYVCHLPAEEIRANRGDFKTPATPSPYRDRSVAENLAEFARMRAGAYKEGEAVLRAKIDLAAQNPVLRDPIMYRIHHAHHYRAGDAWCVYPMYDWAHCLEDSIEEITHSLCTVEFTNNRDLYDWYLAQLPVFPSRQIEFSKMNISHTVMGKRKMLQLVNEGKVAGWDDPRMPTLAGMRRRGFTPAAIAGFLSQLGVSRSPTFVDITTLEHHVRHDLNTKAQRVMGVLDPVKLVITTYPEGQTEHFDVDNNPEDPDAGTRKVPFTREVWVEREDFRPVSFSKWRRLAPGKEVRLKGAYYVTCTEGITNDAGELIEIRATHDPLSAGGSSPDGRKVRGTLHWVSATHGLPATVRIYDRLFTAWNPLDVEEGQDWLDNINPDSLVTIDQAVVEPSLAEAMPGQPLQFLRKGYFCVDAVDSAPGALVFNRTIGLRDNWAKKSKG